MSGLSLVDKICNNTVNLPKKLNKRSIQTEKLKMLLFYDDKEVVMKPHLDSLGMSLYGVCNPRQRRFGKRGCRPYSRLTPRRCVPPPMIRA